MSFPYSSNGAFDLPKQECFICPFVHKNEQISYLRHSVLQFGYQFLELVPRFTFVRPNCDMIYEFCLPAPQSSHTYRNKYFNSKYFLLLNILLLRKKYAYMAIKVYSTTVSFHTQIYSNDMAKLLKVIMQKIPVHHALWNIAAV